MLHGDAYSKPAMLKLDVEGFEHTIIDQLLAMRVPQLNIDFHTDESHTQHPFGPSALKDTLARFADAGYDAFGPNICNDAFGVNCAGSLQTPSHDFRTVPSQVEHLNMTYLHVDFILAAQ
eukprot:COSAG02_NODE_21069_length_804_cov_1.017021_2_plen_120_part_00